jgi:HK97 family phage portal protein
VQNQGEQHTPAVTTFSIKRAYETVEVYNRGINLIVDSAATIPFDIGAKITSIESISQGLTFRGGKLNKLLNQIPNPFIAADELWRNVYLDLILTGNAFIYFDGAHLYNLPADNVEVVADKKAFISVYKYGEEEFQFNEVIAIRDNSMKSLFYGTSRLTSTSASYNTLTSMKSFQNSFFKNGTVLGVVLKSKDTLSQKIKERKMQEWSLNYNTTTGGRRPMILDAGMEIEDLGSKDFRELEYKDSINSNVEQVLLALGIPPVLVLGGNNANISPNLKLFYTQTIIPLVLKVSGSLDRFFGYDTKPDTRQVLALQPELRDEAAYLVSLTNAGIITRNEAREKIRMDKHKDAVADILTLPANIAGSAVNPSANPNSEEV